MTQLRDRRVGPALAVFAVSLLAAAGCSSQPGNATGSSGSSGSTADPTIALILPDVNAPRYEQQDRPKFTAALKKACPKCKLIYFNSKDSISEQQNQAESAVTQGAKVITFVPVDVKAAASIVNYAHSRHVKVIALGRGVVGATPDAEISYDPQLVGEQQASTLMADMKTRGLAGKQVVMINGAPTDDLAVGFKAGAQKTLEKAGVKIGRNIDTPNWDPAVGQTEMDQAITALGKDNIGGVVAANDSLAGAVIAAMKNAGMDPHKIPITGLDADLTGLQNILAGVQAMTVYQPIGTEESVNAQISVALGRGKPVPQEFINGPGPVPTYLYKTVIVTAENMKDTVMKEAGYVNVATLCAGAHQADCAKYGIQ